jgi:hypothetical protein
MDDVEFNIEKQETADVNAYQPREMVNPANDAEPGLVGWLKKKKITKSTTQAYVILFSFVILSLIIAVGLIGYFVLGIGQPQVANHNYPPELQEQLKSING